MEIDLPDNPGSENFKFLLLHIELMDRPGWAGFIHAHFNSNGQPDVAYSPLIRLLDHLFCGRFLLGLEALVFDGLYQAIRRDGLRRVLYDDPLVFKVNLCRHDAVNFG